MTALSDAPARPAEPPEQHLPPVVVAAGILVLLGGLFFSAVSRSELWLDEALSVNIARLPIGDLHAALKQDGAPPLYYLLLHVWTGIFGSGNEAARTLSGLCMAGAAVAIFFATQRFVNRTAAWIAVIVVATSPYAIRYATEARMYALVVLLVACGTVAAQRVIEKPSLGRLAVFALLVALALYTQYWCFYIVGVAGLLFAWMWW
ncbi:MAG TPA: glycosyltransferase family 39 protein, partial [Acidimicrobiia bacterium]|nr:glycosyltransferase family 39 protein [Acidimicrobiia bacterium]